MAFPNAAIIHYPVTNSNHTPVVLSIFGFAESALKSFKFECFWTRDDSCVGMVAKSWSSAGGSNFAHALFMKI